MERLKVSISKCFLFFTCTITIKHPTMYLFHSWCSENTMAKPLSVSPIYYTDISFNGQGAHHSSVLSQVLNKNHKMRVYFMPGTRLNVLYIFISFYPYNNPLKCFQLLLNLTDFFFKSED